MAYITTDNYYMTVLCSKCGQEVKVDKLTGLTNGFITWYSYHCQHCGHIGSIEAENIVSPEHEEYSSQEEPYRMYTTKEETQIIDLNSLKRIADSLDEIKDLLKEKLKNDDKI